MISAKIILDPKQQEIDRVLKRVAAKISYKSKSSIFNLFGFNSKKPQNLSCYIYGDVGRGKSMLMKNFFNLVKIKDKAYFHFHNFMNNIHQALRDIRKEGINYNDELIEATKRVIGNDVRLICLDEFQIVDVADLMLIARSFEYIFSKQVTVIFTSNFEPKNLYQSSLQKDLFLNFINNILLKNCQLLCLDSNKDYRLSIPAISQKYFISKDAKDKKAFDKLFKDITTNVRPIPELLTVWGRELEIKNSYQINSENKQLKIAKLTFDQLCRSNLSANDYRAICKYYDLIFLENLPILSKEEANEAKRFILFIDELYESKTPAVILAEDLPGNIYKNGSNHKVFKRTASRLNEINSWLIK